MDNLDNYSLAEIREQIYLELDRLLMANPAKYRHCMKEHVNNLIQAGEIEQSSSDLMALKNYQLN